MKRFPWRGILDAVPELSLAGAFLIAWIDPSLLPGDPVPGLVGLILLEFIVVHSSAFFGAVVLGQEDLKTRLKLFGGLLALYSLFAAGFALGFRNIWLFIGFLLLNLNRLMGMVLKTGGLRKADQGPWMARWGVSAFFYLVSVFTTLFLPLPRLGIREGLSGYGEGIWIDEPHRAISAGFVYFLAVGITWIVWDAVRFMDIEETPPEGV